ncbi:HNH endonuclease family protein [Bdellovibrio sp. KM01]|uniref:HNH endonuclease family protein n=1 Tax=Bdellovibrio sp. KM01 TaxID=2748865 RepID=UPI0015EA6AFA|nr:HNH endonuclease family protein [Bdellovibrio sp. KM01]QLY24327.1 HNH endonuclease [Bdellovibrio sp. KM01]
MKKLLVGALVSICAVSVHAREDLLSDVSGNNQQFSEYYTVTTLPSFSATPTNTSVDPLQTIQEIFDAAAPSVEIKAAVISLLHFDHHNEDFGNVGQAYNRKQHFGTWIRPSEDHTCLNTRGLVLVRDSKVPVTYNTAGCTVRSGEWDEPYTGATVHDAADIQIDHFVPLKNAYVSGAHKWNYSKRCLYANFLGNNFHLVSTDGHENMSKSDSTPQGYMPPNQAYRCQYLQQWLKVKLIWDLGLTPPEKLAVESLIQQNGCDLNMFQYSVGELQAQRQFMADNANLCH